MTQHEYIFVAISIILGLAITRLLHTVGMLIRAHHRVLFHWSTAVWGLSILIYILQLWWIGWGLRDISEWAFIDFMVLVFGSIALYGASEMALPGAEDTHMDMLQHSQGLGRLSALSMLLYFLIGPYVNIAMYNNAILPSIAIPSIGILLMICTIALPALFRLWSLLFAGYSMLILFLTV